MHNKVIYSNVFKCVRLIYLRVVSTDVNKLRTVSYTFSAFFYKSKPFSSHS